MATRAATGPAEPSWRSPGRHVPLLVGGAIYAVSFLVAAAVLALILLAIGADPVSAYASMLDASFGSLGALSQTLNKTTPLLLAGVAVAFGMRAGYINLGVDGQIYGGAMLAVGASYVLGQGVPFLAWLPLLLVGMLGGAIVAAIPALLRARWGVNELFTTVMFNFVAFYLALYLSTGPWNDPISGDPITRPIADDAGLPRFLTPIGHIGIVLAVGVALLGYLWLAKTRRGFEFRAAGLNPIAARFAGVNLVPVGVGALIAGGMLGGLAGSIEVTGVHQRLIMGFTPEYGLIGVLIAVVARLSLLGVVPTAFFFGVLFIGADSLQRSVGLPSSAVLLFEGIVVLMVLLLEDVIRKNKRLATVLQAGR